MLPISDEQAPYARTILEALQRQGLRASLGPGSQTLSRAIVDAHDAGVPFLAIVGKREAAASKVALRERDGAPERRHARRRRGGAGCAVQTARVMSVSRRSTVLVGVASASFVRQGD